MSVVIPVFRQQEPLTRCLSALEAQRYPSDRFEVIVVDNDRTPGLQPLVARLGRVRWMHEPRPGSYAARNLGITAAGGAVIALTDADCVPADDWIAAGVRAIGRLAGPGMVAGRIDLVLPDPDRPTAAELFELVFGFPQETYLQWGFSATANLFASKTAFDRVGLFDDRLMSGGDAEWGRRLRSHGLAQVYADEVRVSHGARRTLRDLVRKAVRVAGGLQQIAEQRGEGTAGFLAHARRQLLQLRRVRAHIGSERLPGVSRKVRFAAVAWLVDLLQTLERYRVHFGGRPRRA